LSLKLPGNSNYNFTESRYEKSSYTFKFKNVILTKYDGDGYVGFGLLPKIIDIKKYASNDFFLSYDNSNKYDAAVSPINYYMLTQLNNVKTNYNKDSNAVSGGLYGYYTGTGDKFKNNVYINGPVFGFGIFSEGLSAIANTGFYPTPISYNITAGDLTYNDNITSIPIQVKDL
jgi:hypothetical protein